MNKKSLTITVPCFNEENRLDDTLASLMSMTQELQMDYELIFINDGSRDRTQQIIEQFAKSNPRIHAINNEINRGLGYSLKKGFKAAKKDYVTWFPGDNSVVRESMIPIWDSIGSADIVVPTMKNVRDRPISRRFLSLTFTKLINLLFGLKMTYYNGLLIFPTSLVRKLYLSSRGHEIFCEMMVRSLKLGHTYYEIPFVHKVETEKLSRAVSLRNIISILRMIMILIKDIYFHRKPGGIDQ